MSTIRKYVFKALATAKAIISLSACTLAQIRTFAVRLRSFDIAQYIRLFGSLLLTYEPQREMCVRRRLRSDCASAQSDQSLRCPHEETLYPGLSKIRPVKILISVHECAG